MTGRTRYGSNVVDTEQIYDACVTYAKISDEAKASIAALDTTALAAAKVADKTVVKYLSVSLYGTGTQTIPICTVPSISTVTRVITVCEASRVGTTGTIDIGDTGDTDGFLATANIGKTLNDITGDDPASYGVYLWVPAVQTATAAALTGSNSSLALTGANSTWTFEAGAETGGANSTLSETGTNSTLSLSSGGNWAVTTYGHRRTKTYLTDTVINATVTKGDNTAGTMGIYVYYDKLVAST
jgi:hypothetical protein